MIKILAALALTANVASAQELPFESVADFGLNQTVETEMQAFVDIVDAMQTVGETSEIGLALFTRFANTGEMTDDMRLAMENWQSLASMTWTAYDGAIHNAESIIDARIAFHCGETVSVAHSCIDSMEDLSKLFGVHVALLSSMEGLDMLETGFDYLLN